jgi:hypothetical protein
MKAVTPRPLTESVPPQTPVADALVVVELLSEVELQPSTESTASSAPKIPMRLIRRARTGFLPGPTDSLKRSEGCANELKH